MKKHNKIKTLKASNSEVENFLKIKKLEGVSYYRIDHLEEKFRMGSGSIKHLFYKDPFNIEKYELLMTFNVSWNDGVDDTHRCSLIFQMIFNRNKPFDLDTCNISIDIYRLGSLVSSGNHTIHLDKKGHYNFFSIENGLKKKIRYDKGSKYQLNDFFGEEALIDLKEKKIGDQFQIVDLAMDEKNNFTSFLNLKYLNKYITKNKKEHHEIECNIGDENTKLVITYCKEKKIKKLAYGWLLATQVSNLKRISPLN